MTSPTGACWDRTCAVSSGACYSSGVRSTVRKQRFDTEGQAKRAAKRMGKKRKHIPVPFLCPDCHYFHLTSPGEW